jgi:sialate O-acetylesterase
MDGSDFDWRLPDRESVACFSAIGYQFAALLSESLNMPVGIIDCNWGGTKIQSWIPRSVLEQHEETRADLKLYASMQEALGDQSMPNFERYQSSVRDMGIDLQDFITQSLRDPKYHNDYDAKVVFAPPGGFCDPNNPGSLFENMISRVAPFPIAGVLWYQGESNAGADEAHRYASLFKLMRKAWHEAWHDDSIPFLTCQLATFDMPATWGQADWTTLRLQQIECAKLPGVSMAVLLDIGDRTDIHPIDKIPAAQRLHALAMEDVYKKPCDAHEPAPVSCEFTDGNVVLRFDHPIELRDGQLPELLADGEVIPCCAHLKDDYTLILTGRSEAAVASVRYAAANWVIPSLFGKNGLPVSPFRFIANA